MSPRDSPWTKHPRYSPKNNLGGKPGRSTTGTPLIRDILSSINHKILGYIIAEATVQRQTEKLREVEKTQRAISQDSPLNPLTPYSAETQNQKERNRRLHQSLQKKEPCEERRD